MAWTDAARLAAVAARSKHVKFGVKSTKKLEAFFVRNTSASHQLTVMARSSKQARKIGHDILGAKNKSKLSAARTRNVVGYGTKKMIFKKK